MKKLFTFLLLGAAIVFTTQVSAQSPRKAFVEEATQASCPPCAAANPGLQALLNDNHDEAIFVAYQVWWPGYDAMYLDNTTEVDERIGDYYADITGAPNIIVQGNSGAQAVSYLTQGMIDDIYAETSEFDLTVEASIINGQLEISGMAEATAAASGDLRLRLIITEDVIYTEDLVQNGTNGETEFHHVFKAFVNGPDGIDLEDSWAMGDTYTIDETFDLATLNIYDYSGLEVVAIIQNDDDKYVHQAAKASELEIVVDFDNTASAAAVDPIAPQCSGEITIDPVITIANSGNNDLTSALITYSVNGGAEQTFDWTGTLTTLQSEDVALPSYTFTTEASNTLTATVSNPNGMADELDADDVVTGDIALSPDVDFFVVLEMNTDTYADEIYWEVQNSAGTTIASGGNPNVGLENVGTNTFPPPASDDSYANETSYSIGIDIPAEDCYTFYFADFYGDGVAVYGGSFVVTDPEGNVLIDGTEFDGALQVDQYKGTTAGVNVEEVIATNGFDVISNPIASQLDVRLNIEQSTQTSISVLDSQGRVVLNENLGTLGAGQYVQSYDLGSVSSGMYYVRLTTDAKTINKKVIVRK